MDNEDFTVKDIRRAKEVIKEQKHKNDKSKTVIGGVITAGSVVGAGVAATTTATVTTGASLGSITIGGAVGAWLVSHGLLTAATVSTTVVSAPIFLGIALPAVGLFAGYNLIKTHEANKLLKEFATTANIDSLGKKIAEGIFIPVIYFLRSLECDISLIESDIKSNMIKDYGFSESFSNSFILENKDLSLEELKIKIINQDVCIILESSSEKQKKSKELNLSFLHEKAIKFCKSCINKACYSLDEAKRERAEKTIKYMKKKLFKKKKHR